jgi:hypothetical protein
MKARFRKGILIAWCLFPWAAPYGLGAQVAPAPSQPAEPLADRGGAEAETGAPSGEFSLELFVWPANGRPTLREGKASTSGNSSELVHPGKSKPVPGAVLSLPGGAYSNVRLSYFQTRGNGTTIADRELTFSDEGYSAGDLLAAHYKLRHAKISYDYHSYPFPPGDSRVRVRTLWEVQLLWFRSIIDAPFKTPVASGQELIADNLAERTIWLVYPTFGLGMEHRLSPRFRWEAKGSGFGFPRRGLMWDAEVKGAYQVGKFEVLFGAKGFHFKTSPRQVEYVRGTLSGVYVGAGWRP